MIYFNIINSEIANYFVILSPARESYISRARIIQKKSKSINLSFYHDRFLLKTIENVGKA